MEHRSDDATHPVALETLGGGAAAELFSRELAAVLENIQDPNTDPEAVQRGVTLVGTAPVPNPVSLRPYRTFREIEQPESLFVVRVRGGGDEGITAALFEADGAAWKLTAIQRIAAYLRGAVPQTVAILA